MSDRRTTLLIERLKSLAAHKTRFSYDVRGDAFVNSDIVAPYGVGAHGRTDLVTVLEHALTHDAIVTGVKDPESGQVQFTSCRLFTDVGNALRFAREQHRTSVYNWNRQEEISVAIPTPTVAPEQAS
ncbi:MAG TPA: hypothetical protein VHL57_01130 [Flavobacteriales bacterium]|jgi:hypothetical protein|nr:hypothetical protein [Flavobacteriales bacterium]